MALTTTEVARLAALARIALSEDELGRLAPQLDVILGAAGRGLVERKYEGQGRGSQSQSNRQRGQKGAQGQAGRDQARRHWSSQICKAGQRKEEAVCLTVKAQVGFPGGKS